MSAKRVVLSAARPATSLASLLLLALPALQPLAAGELVCGYDQVLHLWRALETHTLLAQGVLLARWQPHMALGLGYPLFTFNPPISAWLAAGFRALGMTWPAAVNAVFGVGLLLAAWSTWVLVRGWWGDGAGLVAGAAITVLPFHAYVTYHRGSMSEALAWAFPPLVLWGLVRYGRDGHRRGLVGAASGMALLLLTHDASAYLFLPLALVSALALAAGSRSRAVLLRTLAALGLGVGLAAFFWLPSLVERRSVQFARVTQYPYAASFVALDYLLEGPRAADTALINPWLPKGIGALPAALALLALPTWARERPVGRWWLGGLALATLGCVWLSLPYAAPVWRWLAPLRYLHFPWRFLTPAAFGVAVLAGAGGCTLTRLARRGGWLVPACLGAGLVVGALGWLYPAHCPLPQPATLGGMLAYERATGQLGGTTFSELLPVWTQRLPNREAFVAEIEAGSEPVRLRPEDLPPGARILEATYGPLEARVVLETPVAFRARYWALYYPGWQVRADGTPIAVGPSGPEGLLSFEVPAGRHTVEVRFAETPLRLGADSLSVVSLALLVLALVRARRADGEPRAPGGPKDVPMSDDRAYLKPLLGTLAVSLLVVTLKLAVIDRFETPLRRSNLTDGRLKRVDVVQEVRFGEEFILLGYDALPTALSSGDRLDVRTYWRALRPGGPDYGVTVHVVDGNGQRWEGADIRPPRWHRTPPPVGEWSPDQYALVALSVPLLAGTPPGVYTLELVAFDRESLAPLTAYTAEGQALGPALALGQIVVTPPRRPLDVDALALDRPLNAAMGPLRLMEAQVDREVAAPGDLVALRVLWRAERTPAEDLVLRVRLARADGSAALETEFPPATTWHPTTAWQAGDVWRGQHALRLPAGLESGAYRWELGLCSRTGGTCSERVAIGALRVSAPERRFEAPPLGVRADVRLGGVVTLLGATLVPSGTLLAPGGTLSVTLVWRAEAEMAVSQRVFLHLLGADGAMLAQSDGEPANWTRPTTGWLPGEVVLDERVLTIPSAAASGEYVLQAGMYTLDGGRLKAADGRDAVRLAVVQVRALP